MRTAVIAVTASVVTAVLVGGVSTAVATAAANGKQVNTCYNKKTGVLRLAKKCARGEGRLALGQVGPRGPVGLQGPAGVPGPKGDVGPSNGYFTQTKSLTGNLTGAYQRVAQLTNPDGQYIVNGSVTVSTGALGGVVSCAEGIPPGLLGGNDSIFFEKTVSIPANSTASLSITGYRTGFATYLECRDVFGLSTSVTSVALSAVKVGSVTVN